MFWTICWRLAQQVTKHHFVSGVSMTASSLRLIIQLIIYTADNKRIKSTWLNACTMCICGVVSCLLGGRRDGHTRGVPHARLSHLHNHHMQTQCHVLEGTRQQWSNKCICSYCTWDSLPQLVKIFSRMHTRTCWPRVVTRLPRVVTRLYIIPPVRLHDGDTHGMNSSTHLAIISSTRICWCNTVLKLALLMSEL